MTLGEEYRTGISFSMKRRRVLIYRCTLRSLGVPKNIRFLLNMKQKRIAVQVCEAIDRDSFTVPEFDKGEKTSTRSAASISLRWSIRSLDGMRTVRIGSQALCTLRTVWWSLNWGMLH